MYEKMKKKWSLGEKKNSDEIVESIIAACEKQIFQDVMLKMN